MLKSLAERILNWLKPVKKPEKNQWVTVSISFILAVTLWFLVTLNTQSFSRYYSIPVKLSNFPEDLQLTREFPSQMRVLAKGVGIDLLYQQFESQDTLTINFNNFKDRREFVSRNNFSLITQALKPKLNTVWAFPDTISLAYLPKANKRVPIVLDLDLNLPPAYRIAGKLRPGKDTVLIIGPEDSLKRITSWKTTHYKTELLVSPKVLYVPVETIYPFQVLPNKIPVKVNPIPFTERTLSVPIRKTYVPKNTGLNLDTDSIQVHFLLPMEEYDQISAADFRIDVDYRDLNLRSDYLIPVMKFKPKNVTIQKVSPKLVRYKVIYQD